MAIVRPSDAWNRPDDLLNLPVAPLQGAVDGVDDAVEKLFSANRVQ
jgi:hypothetical protein